MPMFYAVYSADLYKNWPRVEWIAEITRDSLEASAMGRLTELCSLISSASLTHFVVSIDNPTLPVAVNDVRWDSPVVLGLPSMGLPATL